MQQKLLDDIRKKREDDIKAIYDVMDRHKKYPDRMVVDTKSQAGGGFRMPGLSHIQNLQHPHQQKPINGPQYKNPLSKDQIYSFLGIANPEDDKDFDPNILDKIGSKYDTKLDLADAILPSLEMLREKNAQRRTMIAEKLSDLKNPNIPTEAGFNSSKNLGGSSRKQKNLENRHNGELEQFKRGQQFTFGDRSTMPKGNHQDLYFDSFLPGDGSNRAKMVQSKLAEDYNSSNRDLPISGELDLLHKGPDRYQVAEHWTSNLEVPNQENVEV